MFKKILILSGFLFYGLPQEIVASGSVTAGQAFDIVIKAIESKSLDEKENIALKILASMEKAGLEVPRGTYGTFIDQLKEIVFSAIQSKRNTVLPCVSLVNGKFDVSPFAIVGLRLISGKNLEGTNLTVGFVAKLVLEEAITLDLLHNPNKFASVFK